MNKLLILVERGGGQHENLHTFTTTYRLAKVVRMSFVRYMRIRTVKLLLTEYSKILRHRLKVNETIWIKDKHEEEPTGKENKTNEKREV